MTSDANRVQKSTDDLIAATDTPVVLEEDLMDFLGRLVEAAEDWRISDELLGNIVRSRWPVVYPEAADA